MLNRGIRDGEWGVKMKRLLTSTLLIASTLYAGDASLTVSIEFESSQDIVEKVIASEATETAIYDYDASYIENNVSPVNMEAVYPKKIALPPPQALISIEYIYSENYRVLNIPISFRLNDHAFFKARIPFIYRKIKYKGKEYEASGLGDIYVGTDLIWVRTGNFSVVTSIATSLPTGDNENTDDGVLVPLGKDAENIHVSQTLSWAISDIVFAITYGFKHYFSDNVFTYQDVTYREKIGTRHFFNIDISKDIKNLLRAGIRAVYFQSSSSKLKIGDETVNLNNSVKAADLVAYVIPNRFKFRNFAFRFSVIIPIYTDYGSGLEDEERELAASVSIVKAF